MRIGICDDERIWLEEAKKIVESYGNKKGWEMEIHCFSCRRELLSYKGKSLDVLLLDIELEEDSGIEIARMVNERWKNCQIVYLTNYLFYATEVYHTLHAFFVLKEQFRNRVEEVFEKVLHKLAQSERKLVFLTRSKKIVLAPEEIYYFERELRVTVIHAASGTWEVPEKLTDILKRLSPLDFVRCHNSFVVYFPAVKEIKKNSFLMNNGEEIIISRAYTKKVKEVFAQWALTQIS